MPLPQPLSRVLAADANVAGWDARRRREDTLTALVRRHLPRPLADRVRVTDARSAELALGCDGGAVAALVRQRTPELLAALADSGCEFTGIRVRVQVKSAPILPPKLARNQPDRASLRPLAGLARALPESALRTSLERLLRRLG